MAEQSDEKSKLPLTGLVALVVAAVSSLIIYQVPLKTSRPIDKEAEKYVSVKANRVQARLWQDPFEAVATHQLKEAASKPTDKEAASKPIDKNDVASKDPTFSDVVQVIKSNGAKSPFLVFPVFVDGNPYANGVESRLKDRYAVVSALGAAGYLPESGDYIRYFKWEWQKGSSLVIPIERFHPDPHTLGSPIKKDVLVLWLKDQDFNPNPLASLGNLVAKLNGSLGQSSATYKILGPRFSGSLAAMHEELCRQSRDLSTVLYTRPVWAVPAKHRMTLNDLPLSYSLPLGMNALNDTTFYSSWATVADAFLGGECHDSNNSHVETRSNSYVKKWSKDHVVRTIQSDEKLAEQLVEELDRRGVNMSVSPKGIYPTPKKPRIALISEWDTLYGRALPLTFVAMAETICWKVEAHPSVRSIDRELDALRKGAWPSWVQRYSYLAGLDGELPPKDTEKDSGGVQPTGKTGNGNLSKEQSLAEAPAGRSQLDYLRRLVESLKREESTNDVEFRAIGVLGSDVYDKLMILQALRNEFPRAIFFTTDLDARLTHSTQGQWTRNLIVASHFGLELHPELQTPIPPFRDSYQTALFYSVLQALEYLLPLPVEHAEVRNSVTGVSYSIAGTPRLYEIGRDGAVDISLDEPRDILSIHVPRSDISLANGRLLLPDTLKSVWVVLALGAIVLCALLLNSEFLEQFRPPKLMRTLILTLFSGILFVSLPLWAISDGAAGEPFSLTEGISVWPTTLIRLFAFVLCGVFLYYSTKKLETNDQEMYAKYELDGKWPKELDCSPFGIHFWRPGRKDPVPVQASAVLNEYQRLGQLPIRLRRIVPQTLCYLTFGILLMQLSGFPTIPCRGAACFQLNYFVLALSVIAMTYLMFYVVDATRLCRRLIKIMSSAQIKWSGEILVKESETRDVGESLIPEWLGIELIAKRTNVISFMLYYPFIILFLMGVARHTYFDRWDFPVALMIIFGLNAAYALGNAVYLRRSAEKARQMAVKRLKVKMDELSIKTPFKQRETKQVQEIIDLIEKNQEGAFLPFTQHPVFGAIALPTGGTGLLLLIEYFAKMM